MIHLEELCFSLPITTQGLKGPKVQSHVRRLLPSGDPARLSLNLKLYLLSAHRGLLTTGELQVK